MRIAIDAMGGDNAPSEIVKGAVLAAQEIQDDIILVGPEGTLRAMLDAYAKKYRTENISIVGATEVITGEDHPVQAVRHKKDSSMVVAADLIKNGAADALLSAGNTGALMAASLLRIGRIEGVERPAIVAAIPNLGGEGFSLLVDAGANAECRPSHLLCFAYMGSIYMKRAYGIEDPRIGLINNGTEETKGPELQKQTHQLLKESGLNFVGNIEARDIPKGSADVLVCDGFTGNIVLKLMEGTAWSLLKQIKKVMTKNARTKIGGAILKGDIQELKDQFDYSNYGGTPILGVKGLVLKMHGASKSEAVKNAVIRAAAMSDADFADEIEAAMKKSADEGAEAAEGAGPEKETEA